MERPPRRLSRPPRPALDAPSALESLRNELSEVRRRLSHYQRLTTELELRLEQVDREQQRAHRRALELTESIETEETILHTSRFTVTNAAQPCRRLGRRETEILEILGRHPGEHFTAAWVATAIQTTNGNAWKLLSRLRTKGHIAHVGHGVYRAL